MTEDIIAYQVDEEESKKLNFLRTKLLGLGAQEL